MNVSLRAEQTTALRRVKPERVEVSLIASLIEACFRGRNRPVRVRMLAKWSVRGRTKSGPYFDRWLLGFGVVWVMDRTPGVYVLDLRYCRTPHGIGKRILNILRGSFSFTPAVTASLSFAKFVVPSN